LNEFDVEIYNDQNTQAKLDEATAALEKLNRDKELQANMPKELSSLKDDEKITIRVSDINEVPEEFRDRIIEGKDAKGITTTQKSFLGLFGYGKKNVEIQRGDTVYQYEITGKEAKDQWIKQNTQNETPALETPAVEGQKTENELKVEELRAKEQAELAEAIPNIEEYKVDGKVDESLITDPADLKAYKEIYGRYDKLITPLLEGTEAEQVAPVETEQVEAPKAEVKSNKIENYNGIFSVKTTGIPKLDELLKDDGYNYFYKGVSGEIVMMSQE
jgi:hypothetical protein